MHIELCGNGNEIGRAAYLVSDSKSSVMLDYGVKINPEPPQYPLPAKPDAVVLSHAHLDHCGGMPLLYRHGTIPAFMTDVTLDLTKLLVEDALKVGKKQGYNTPFGVAEIKRMVKNAKLVDYGEQFRAGAFSGKLYDAGHIPGSAGVLLKNEKSVFYTGDIQTAESHLLSGCTLPKRADVLVTETTYSYKNHSPRIKEEERLVEHVEEALAREEIALFPVFSIGRAQEVLLILEKYAHKIALDGMAKQASDIIASYGARTKDSRRLKAVLRKINWIHTREDRLKALKRHSIILATAGMLGGGPAIHYLREIKHRTESKVLFTGFLVEESPGRNLIETNIFKNAEEKFHVHCELDKFELSAHTDRRGLFHIIRKTNPATVISVHGERCDDFAKDIEQEFPGIQAIAPRNGDTIRI
ncbi:MAG: MBL fold metallo-hydrolase [Candidatus Aenigmarchaeota archaeon]|nr:MBL fold metallo-hydrolase [Candidatus Aenigmarchaeota archaeon]